ncbi:MULTISPECIES: hypothetical protein [Metabacillus]|uniref:Uncharacterized protein n=1 Tax=Metabacillus hrfriensis TaxID=3048891 RepID=A0ACD4R6U4_9BACI|nr:MULTISPECIES: hypothetical protein [Metabacillus]WHZ56169.1 hypothetical protein QLQ22_15865 [Metabacillus sp. CT-WN-B3]
MKETNKDFTYKIPAERVGETSVKKTVKSVSLAECTDQNRRQMFI